MCQNDHQHHGWHILSDSLFLWCLWMMPLRWLYSGFLLMGHCTHFIRSLNRQSPLQCMCLNEFNSWPYLETDVVGYRYPVLHVVSYALIFRCGELLFSYIRAVPFYRILFLNLPTYLPTPWRGVLLEKLTGSQLIKKFPAFYGTQRWVQIITLLMM
jgi:hypothetical protein